MTKRNTIKKTIDISEELFERIMQYATARKVYKFSPTAADLLDYALLEKEKQSISEGKS